MISILKNISDPSWWFTAFFVAIVSSVLAGFLKDKVERYLSRISESYRERRSAAIKRRAEIIEALATDPHYLSFSMHRATMRLIIWSILTLMFLLTPITVAVVPEKYDALLWFNQKHIATSFLLPLMGFASIWIGFKATSSASVVLQAAREYRDRKNLPRVP